LSSSSSRLRFAKMRLFIKKSLTTRRRIAGKAFTNALLPFHQEYNCVRKRPREGRHRNQPEGIIFAIVNARREAVRRAAEPAWSCQHVEGLQYDVSRWLRATLRDACVSPMIPKQPFSPNLRTTASWPDYSRSFLRIARESRTGGTNAPEPCPESTTENCDQWQ